MNFQFLTAIITVIGLIMPFLILQFNRGYRTANRFLAAYLFFSSLYLLGNFYFFYGNSESWIAFFVLMHPFFYLIGPFSFIYARSIIKDNNSLTTFDWIHLLPFIISFIGLIPFMFTDWEHKLIVSRDIKSETWDTAKFHINFILSTKVDQALSLLQTIFYAGLNWYMIGKRYKKLRNDIPNVAQYQLIKKWLITFCSIYTIIAINYLFVMLCIWFYPLKSVFLLKANYFLLVASIIYFCVNLSLLFFPQIMYGLPVESIVFTNYSQWTEHPNRDQNIENPIDDELNKIISYEDYETAVLFSDEYIDYLNEVLAKYYKEQQYLSETFKLSLISAESGIPIHHLTYYFNFILKTSFSDWRNKLRIEYAIHLFAQGAHKKMNLNGIAEQCGFSIPSTFIRSFKKFTGKTPSEYHKSLS